MNSLARTITMVGIIKENGFAHDILTIEYDYKNLADQLMLNGKKTAPNVNSKYLQRLYLEDVSSYDRIINAGLEDSIIIDSILSVDFELYKDLDLDCIIALQKELKYVRYDDVGLCEAYLFLKNNYTECKLYNSIWLLKQQIIFSFEFKEVLKQLNAVMSEIRLDKLQFESEGQIEELISLCNNDTDNVIKLAMQFDSILPSSIFYTSPKSLITCNESLIQAGVSDNSRVSFICKYKLDEKWILMLINKLHEYSCNELELILTKKILLFAACDSVETFHYINTNIEMIMASNIYNCVYSLFSKEEYAIARNICSVIISGFRIIINSVLARIFDFDNIDYSEISTDQIKHFGSIRSTSMYIPVYPMDCNEYEFLSNIPRKYSLLAENLQHLEKSLRLATVKRMLDFNALAYVSKFDIPSVIDVVTDTEFDKNLVRLPVNAPLYVKLCVTTDKRITDQIVSLEDAKFLAWCLQDVPDPDSKLEDIKNTYLVSDIYAVKLQEMFSNMMEKVNISLLHDLCLSRESRYIIEYLTNSSVNRTSKRLLKLAMIAYMCRKYYDFKYKDGLLRRELALNITDEFLIKWKGNYELIANDLSIKECDNFTDVIDFGLDPIKTSINMYDGSERNALPSMFSATRKIISIIKNDVCIAQAQLILTKIRNDGDTDAPTTIEQSDLECTDKLLLIDSINYLSGIDKNVLGEIATLIIEYLDKRAVDLGVKAASADNLASDDSYSLRYKEIFIPLTRSGNQKIWFRMGSVLSSMNEGTYIEMPIYMRE